MASRMLIPSTAFSLGRGKKRPRKESVDHLKWIRSLPCIITGKRGLVAAAHVRYGDPAYGKRETGLGEKPDDRWSVPLSHHLHTGDLATQHANGEREWWAGHKIDPLSVALALHGMSGDDEAAETILRNARKHG